MAIDLAAPREVMVVGAGPAGACTARLLARAGVSTTLVERKRVPRFKVERHHPESCRVCLPCLPCLP